MTARRLRRIGSIALHEAWAARAAAGAGVAVALVAWTLPWLLLAFWPGVGDVREAAAMVTWSLFALLLPVLVGGSVLAHDLVEGRMGFWLGLPVGPGSLLLGKLLGAAAAVSVGLVLAALPLVAMGGQLPSRVIAEHVLSSSAADAAAWDGGLLAMLLVLLLLLGHSLALALRVRTAWLGLYLPVALSVPASLWVGWGTVAPLGSEAAVRATLAGTLAWLIVGLALAAWLALGRGRSLSRPTQRWHVGILACGLLPLLPALSLWTGWLRSADPDDLAVLLALRGPSSPHGSLAVVSGPQPRRLGVCTTLALDLAGGGWTKVGGPGFRVRRGASWTCWPMPLVFDSAGAGAVVVYRNLSGAELAWLRIGEDGPTWSEIPGGISERETVLALDGERLALEDRHRIRVVRLPRGEPILDVPRPGLVPELAWFGPGGDLVLYGPGPSGRALARLAVPGGEVLARHDLTGVPYGAVTLAPDRDRALVVPERWERQVVPEAVAVRLDGTTRRLVDASHGDRPQAGTFLSDGRVAVATWRSSPGGPGQGQERSRLLVFGEDGVEDLALDLPGRVAAVEPAPEGRLVVWVGPWPGSDGGPWEVDPTRGTVAPTDRWPIPGRLAWPAEISVAVPGEEWGMVYRDGAWRLPETGPGAPRPAD